MISMNTLIIRTCSFCIFSEETEVKDEVRKVASVGRNFSKPEPDTGTPE